MVEVLAQAGADWLLLDMEHGQADLAEVRLLVHGAESFLGAARGG